MPIKNKLHVQVVISRAKYIGERLLLEQRGIVRESADPVGPGAVRLQCKNHSMRRAGNFLMADKELSIVQINHSQIAGRNLDRWVGDAGNRQAYRIEDVGQQRIYIGD